MKLRRQHFFLKVKIKNAATIYYYSYFKEHSGKCNFLTGHC